jgi:hypothetical protein
MRLRESALPKYEQLMKTQLGTEEAEGVLSWGVGIKCEVRYFQLRVSSARQTSSWFKDKRMKRWRNLNFLKIKLLLYVCPTVILNNKKQMP